MPFSTCEPAVTYRLDFMRHTHFVSSLNGPEEQNVVSKIIWTYIAKCLEVFPRSECTVEPPGHAIDGVCKSGIGNLSKARSVGGRRVWEFGV